MLIRMPSWPAWDELTGIINNIAIDMSGSISAEHGIGQSKTYMMPKVKSPLEMELLRGPEGYVRSERHPQPRQSSPVMSQDLSFRPFADSDEEVVISLWERCGLTRPHNNPVKDIAYARDKPGSAILVGELEGELVASVMVGHDGHRGALYYVSDRPQSCRARATAANSCATPRTGSRRKGFGSST